MADTPNPAPAGAGDAPTRPEGMSVLDMAWEGDPIRDVDASEEADMPEEAEPAVIEDPETPEGDEGSDDAGEPEDTDEGPEGDASEPEPKDTPSDDDETGTRMHRLRDGTSVSLADLKKGFDRAREFERALPQIQQERARFMQERQAFAAQQQQIQPILAQVATVLQSQLPPEPDAALVDPNSAKYDPIEHYHQTLARNQAMARLQQVNQAHQQQMQAAQAQQMQQRQQFLAVEQQRLVEAIPDLRDPEKAKAFNADYQRVGRAVGFNDQELGQVFDHRLFKLAQLAAVGLKAQEAEARAKQDKAQKAQVAARKVAAVPPVTPPAARQSAGVRQDQSSRGALERLRKTGSTADAEAFLSQFE